MPAQRKTNQGKRLTGAGLIAVTAATLLMMAWAIFPSVAMANGTVSWTGNGTSGGQLDNEECDASNTPYLLWIFPIGGQNTVTSVTLNLGGSGSGSFTVDSTDTDASDDTSGFTGGSVHIRTPFFDLSSLTASISYVGDLGTGEHKLVISHGCPGEEKKPDLGITKSATSTQVTEGGAVSYTITVTNTGDASATNVVVTDDLDNNLTGVSVSASQGTCDPVGAGNQITCNIGTLGAGQSVTVSISATAPQLPLTQGGSCTLQLLNQATVDSNETTPETSNQVTVTVTGTGCESGGGGGGGATTPPPAPTTPPAIAPTTVHNTSSPTKTDEVLPTTVKPAGTAFTGPEDVVPIGTLALILMTSGSGLLWAGARRRRHDRSEDEV